MRALFQPSHFAELANFLVLARQRRFADDGATQMQAAAEAAAQITNGGSISGGST
jgi:hypothetical protein